MAGTGLSDQRPARAASLLRDRAGLQRVTNIELFFDLVYVFAVTQLSHYLLDHPSLRGGLQAGLLLIMVWLLWAYTTWVTNWVDPDQMPVRLLVKRFLAGPMQMLRQSKRASYISAIRDTNWSQRSPVLGAGRSG
jgi:low temperature requirement protein LtrA